MARAQSFEPPSTRRVSPLIQRASLEERKATTPPISSGWARRFSVAFLPAYTQNFMPRFVISRPIKRDPPVIDLVIGYNKTNTSPTLKLFLSRVKEMIDRVSNAG